MTDNFQTIVNRRKKLLIEKNQENTHPETHNSLGLTNSML